MFWRFVPYEYMTRLCNEVGADGWFCMPTAGNDSHFQQALTLIHNSMPAPRHVYVEYSTKTWDFSGTPQAHYCSEQGQLLFGRTAEEEFLSYYGFRSAQTAMIARSIWGDDPRLHTVIQTFTDWVGLETAVLTAPYWQDSTNPANQYYNPDLPPYVAPYTLFNCLAVHSQLDGGMAYGDRAADLLTWSTTLTQTEFFNRLRDQILTGAYWSAERTVEVLTGKWEYYRTVCDTYQIEELICYEAGSHLNSVSANQSVIDLVHAFHRSPQFAQVISAARQGWIDAGGNSPWAYSVDCRIPDNNQAAGLQQWLGDHNPVWTVVNNFNLQNNGPTGRATDSFLGTDEGGVLPVNQPKTIMLLGNSLPRALNDMWWGGADGPQAGNPTTTIPDLFRSSFATDRGLGRGYQVGPDVTTSTLWVKNDYEVGHNPRTDMANYDAILMFEGYTNSYLFDPYSEPTSWTDNPDLALAASDFTAEEEFFTLASDAGAELYLAGTWPRLHIPDDQPRYRSDFPRYDVSLKYRRELLQRKLGRPVHIVPFHKIYESLS